MKNPYSTIVMYSGEICKKIDTTQKRIVSFCGLLVQQSAPVCGMSFLTEANQTIGKYNINNSICVWHLTTKHIEDARG